MKVYVDKKVAAKTTGLAEKLAALGEDNGHFVTIEWADYGKIRHQLGLPPVEFPKPVNKAAAPVLVHPPLPGLGTMAKNAAMAVAQTVIHSLTGNPLYVPEGVFNQRQTICRGCDEFLPDVRRCSICGCNCTNTWVGKMRLASQKCPSTPPKWDVWTPGT